MPSSLPEPPARMVGRFAPSPTGPLHFGSLVAALASYLDARHAKGAWLVRMEDVDETRCRPEWADRILRQLEALGLEWDGAVWVQSQRKAAYQSALDRLVHQGDAYPCTCSRGEVARDARPGIDGPVYPGTCRQQPARGGEPAAWRMRTHAVPIQYLDGLQGLQSQVLIEEVGDFVIRRRDGLFAYQLAVVVDDAEQGVNRIVRGADLLDSTPRQIHLLQRLGKPVPGYLHVPVAVTPAGQKLSKQTLAPPLNEAAPLPERAALLNSALEFLGQPRIPADAPQDVLAAAVAGWNPGNLPPGPSRPSPSTPFHQSKSAFRRV